MSSVINWDHINTGGAFFAHMNIYNQSINFINVMYIHDVFVYHRVNASYVKMFDEPSKLLHK